MAGYVTIGANDLPGSGRFYTAILIPLGYTMAESALGFAFTAPDEPGWANGPGAIYVKQPFDGNPATAGNGAMTAFEAATQGLVRTIHAAGLAAGGTNEGPPGYRPDYSANFYVAYLRDPLGNKVAIFSTNPPKPNE